MAYKVKMNDDGTPVYNGGLITLVDDENDKEVSIDPAARHAKCMTFEHEEPKKNAAIKKIKAQLAAYDELKEKYPDIYSDPETVAASLAELVDLNEKGGAIDERIKALHTEYGGKIETMKSEHEAALTEKDGELDIIKKQMRMQQYLVPWSTSKQLAGYLLPRDPAMLSNILLVEVDGKKISFNDDNTVSGWNGEPLIDYSNNKPITDPEKVLEIVLATHPLRDRIKLSDLPSGGGMGGQVGGGGGSDIERHFNPKTRNLTEQLKVKESNPALYDQMKKKYS